MTDHSPTPWQHRAGILHEASDKWKCVPINSPYVEGAFDEGKDGHEKAEANAAFIVKAVNSHDALVKALHWIANSPAAHPGNMVTVARDALDLVGTGKQP